MHNDLNVAPVGDETKPAIAGNTTADAGSRNILEEFDALKADVAAMKTFFGSASGEQVVSDARGLGDVAADVEMLKGAVGTLQRATGLHGLEEAAVAGIGMLVHHKP